MNRQKDCLFKPVFKKESDGMFAEGRTWWLFYSFFFTTLFAAQQVIAGDKEEDGEDGKDRKGVILHASQTNAFSQDYESRSWCCPASPGGACHWTIDVLGWGLGRYCGEKRQFAVADYEAVDECEWDRNFLIR